MKNPYINSRNKFFNDLSAEDKKKYGSVLADNDRSDEQPSGDIKGEDVEPIELPVSDLDEPGDTD